MSLRHLLAAILCSGVTALLSTSALPSHYADRCEVHGDVAYCLELATAAHRRDDPTDLELYLAFACGHGHAGACTTLASRWEYHESAFAALPPYERGCRGGSPRACASLGTLRFELRELLGARLFEILEPLSQGCRGGHGMSCHNLGRLEQAMSGPDRAEPLYLRACRLGSADGCAALPRHVIALEGMGAQVSYDTSEGPCHADARGRLQFCSVR